MKRRGIDSGNYSQKHNTGDIPPSKRRPNNAFYLLPHCGTKLTEKEIAVTAPEWFKEGVKAALLAPTAINQQKFLIKLNADESVSFVDRGGVFSKVDLGIVKYHFEIGSGRQV